MRDPDKQARELDRQIRAERRVLEKLKAASLPMSSLMFTPPERARLGVMERDGLIKYVQTASFTGWVAR